MDLDNINIDLVVGEDLGTSLLVLSSMLKTRHSTQYTSGYVCISQIMSFREFSYTSTSWSAILVVRKEQL
jgi:hypothetical protein